MSPSVGFKCNWLTSRLRERIVSGEYPLGGRLPGTQELASEYSVSYVTVHKALVRLEQEGYVTRKQGVGSRVSYIRNDSPPLKKIVNLIADIPEHPATQEFLEQGRALFEEHGWEVHSFRIANTGMLRDEVLLAVNSPDAYSLFFNIPAAFQNTLATEEHFYRRAIYVGQYLMDSRLTCITCDEAATVRLVLDYFEGQGCVRPALFRYQAENLTEHLRHSFWCSELLHRGKPFKWITDHLFQCHPTANYHDTQWMKDSFCQLRDGGLLDDIDCLFIPYERHAFVFSELCAQTGIAIPGDLTLVTLGIDPRLHAEQPPISFVDNRLEHHLRLALDILERRMRGESIPALLYVFHPRLCAAGHTRTDNSNHFTPDILPFPKKHPKQEKTK